MIFEMTKCLTIKIIIMKKIVLFLICMVMATLFAFAQKNITVKAGTIVPLQSVKQVKAADANEGEIVDFRVISDIVVDNCIAIPRGTLVKGVVNEAKRSSIAGIKGRLVINISNLILPSGEQIFFSNTAARVYGKNKTPLAVGTAILLLPCIFITGTKAVMPEGYEVYAVVAANTEIKIN